jgi:hypothetical protein
MKLKRAQMARRKYTNACNIKQGYSKLQRVILRKIREVEHGNCQFEIGFLLLKL